MNARKLTWRYHDLPALVLVTVLCIVVATRTVQANETDNFYLPLDMEMADIGPFLETVHTVALEETVAEVNSRIESVLRIRNEAKRTEQLRALHDPLTLAKAFAHQFGYPLMDDLQLERALRGSWARDSYPAQKPAHQNLWMNFSAHVPFDVRRWMMLKQSETIKVYGVYFGTDKLVHFHRVAADYYEMYLSLVRSGVSTEEAYKKVIERNTHGGFWSEGAMFGSIISGIYSNADLAANHAGFKFYINLTEKVVLKGEEREPLMVRSGVFWRLNLHIRARSGWFSAYVSDHWNEALNPNRYSAAMRAGIRRVLQSRAKSIIQFYTQRDGRPDDPAYFNDLATELSTYYGEPYGHSDPTETLMTIGNTCFPAIAGKAAALASP